MCNEKGSGGQWSVRGTVDLITEIEEGFFEEVVFKQSLRLRKWERGRILGKVSGR